MEENRDDADKQSQGVVVEDAIAIGEGSSLFQSIVGPSIEPPTAKPDHVAELLQTPRKKLPGHPFARKSVFASCLFNSSYLLAGANIQPGAQTELISAPSKPPNASCHPAERATALRTSPERAERPQQQAICSVEDDPEPCTSAEAQCSFY